MPSVLDPYQEIVRIRLSEYPDLSAERLFRELRESRGSGREGAIRRCCRFVRGRSQPYGVLAADRIRSESCLLSPGSQGAPTGCAVVGGSSNY